MALTADLRAALDETLMPYLDQTGWPEQTIALMLDGVTARLSVFHGVAARAARDTVLDALEEAVGALPNCASNDHSIHRAAVLKAIQQQRRQP